jgi:hypothetical protein
LLFNWFFINKLMFSDFKLIYFEILDYANLSKIGNLLNLSKGLMKNLGSWIKHDNYHKIYLKWSFHKWKVTKTFWYTPLNPVTRVELLLGCKLTKKITK